MPLESGFLDIPQILKDIDYSKLDAADVVDDTIARIQTEYPELLTDFEKSNAARVMLEATAKLAEKMSARTEVMAQNMLLPTVRHRPSAAKILNLINYQLGRPSAAMGDASVAINEAITQDVTIPARSQFKVPGPDGRDLYYEFFTRDSQGNIDYDTDIIIPAGQTEVTGLVMLEGQSMEDEFTNQSTESYPIFKLSETAVLDAPVRVWVNSEMWTQVDRLAYQDTAGKFFEVRRDAFDGVYVRFGNGFFGAKPAQGSQIVVYYRIGGGSRGNIVPGYLNLVRSIYVPLLDKSIAVSFQNTSATSGGTDEETLDHAKLYGPKYFATGNRAVCGEDYTVFANKFSSSNGSILKAIAVHRGRASVTGSAFEPFVITGTNNILSVSTKLGTLEFALTHGTRTAAEVAADITAAGAVNGFAASSYNGKVTIYTMNDDSRDITLNIVNPSANPANVTLGLGVGIYGPWGSRHVDVYAFARGPLDVNGIPTLLPMPTALKDELRLYLSDDRRKMLTDEVEVHDASMLSVPVRADVLVSRSVSATMVKSKVDAAIYNFFNPEIWDFGQICYTVDLIKTMYNAIPGIEEIILQTPANPVVPATQQLIVRGATEIRYMYVERA